mmetsp:Transcript_21091/g.40856  ORF Transcript_21091/g.40856 Transcript_21091/m.40856 type:complete len:332 (+) Transcript_21091:85-1080(+)
MRGYKSSMSCHTRALLISMGMNMAMACAMLFLASSMQSGAAHISASLNGAAVRRSLVSTPNFAARSAMRNNIVANAGVRKFFVGGNWKCNGNRESIKTLIEGLNQGAPVGSDVEVVCAPPAPYLDYTRQNLRKDFAVAGQDSWVSGQGAYTGEIAPEMLKDIGCEWVILGHSERRHLPEIKETDKTVAVKTKNALDNGLGVILCIGELLEEREAGKTIEVCERQMEAVAETIKDWSKVVVAYEPVWAIGTGKVATPEQAQEVHDAVRGWMAKNISPEVAASTRILYGGSVNPQNCDELATKPDIDGFLVGGASLKPDFLRIVDSYKQAVVQ